MRVQEELVARLAARRAEALGGLSKEAFAELELAVRAKPESFVEADAERALMRFAKVLEADAEAKGGEEFLDDDAYELAHARRIERLRAGCQAVLEIDPDCLDAKTSLALLHDDAGEALKELLGIQASLGDDEAAAGREAGGAKADGAGGGVEGAKAGGASEDAGAGSVTGDTGANSVAKAATDAGNPGDVTEGEPSDSSNNAEADGANLILDDGLWGDVFARPALRLRAAIARTCLDTTRFKMTAQVCKELIDLAPADPLGARYTWALALARLEDERGFNELDARFGHRGNTWSHLARTLLMFKLDRMAAARRALRGYASLTEGGAYALLRPIYVDAYLPDRPLCGQGSFEEAVLAVHEADPVVVDTPDFVAWCAAQPGFSEEAQRFAEDHDFDW